MRHAHLRVALRYFINNLLKKVAAEEPEPVPSATKFNKSDSNVTNFTEDARAATEGPFKVQTRMFRPQCHHSIHMRGDEARSVSALIRVHADRGNPPYFCITYAIKGSLNAAVSRLLS